MNNEIMSEFLEGAGRRLYRDLVETHIRKSSAKKIQQAALYEITNLPDNLVESVEHFIDLANTRFGYEKSFWDTTNCQEAFERIMEVAIESFPISEKIPALSEALMSENQKLSFALFQIITLNFAYSASTQKEQRKFMGIRKGIFG